MSGGIWDEGRGEGVPILRSQTQKWGISSSFPFPFCCQRG
ncbi:hypothetical protein HMPREF1548_00436 [Clostridium sp. KLE 1755]|nr:hypothetical protein HMPREF1548_00436 [Clostridium sp. KLE 1755]